MLSRSSNRFFLFNKTRRCLISSTFINNNSLATSNAVVPSSRSTAAHFVSSSSRNNDLVNYNNRNQYYWNGSSFGHRFKSVVAAASSPSSSSHDSSTSHGSSSAHTISSTNENEEEEKEAVTATTTPTTVDFDSYNVVVSNDEEEQALLEEEEEDDDDEEEEEKESKTTTWVLGSTLEGIDDEQYNIDIYEAYFKYQGIPEPFTKRELEQKREEKFQSKISKLERLLNNDVAAYEQDDTTTTQNQKQRQQRRRRGKRDNRTTLPKQGSSTVNEYQVIQLYYQIDAASDKRSPLTYVKPPLELHLDVMEFLIRRHCINEAFKVFTTLESIRFSEKIKVQAIRLLIDGLKNQSKLALGSYHGTIRRNLQSKILTRSMLRTYYKQLFDIILRENHKELLPDLLVSIVAHREHDTVLGNLSRQVYEQIVMMEDEAQQQEQQQQQQDEGDQKRSTTSSSSSLIHPKWLYDVLKETSNNYGYSSKFIGHQPYVYDESRGEHVTYTEESMDYYVRTNAVSGNSATRNDSNHNNNDSTAAAPLPIDDVLQRLVFDYHVRPHPMVITKLLEAEHPYCHNPQRLSNILDCILHLIRTTPPPAQQQQQHDNMNDYNNEEQQDFTTTTMMESSLTDDESETARDTEEEEEDGDDDDNNSQSRPSRQGQKSLPPYVYRFENGLIEQLFIMCSRWGDPEMVLKLWDIVDFYAAKKPTIEMYESTIQTFIATSKTTDKQAFAVMKEMELDQGFEVSHAMIRNIARSLRVSDVRLENAHRIVTYVDRNTGTGVASVSSYNCLLAAYAEMGNVPKTFELFDEMSSQYGLKANMFSYSCLLESLANHLKTITLRPSRKKQTKRTQSLNDDSNFHNTEHSTMSVEEQSKLDSVVESADGIMNMIRRDQEEQQQQSSTLIADQDNGLCFHQYIRILCFRGNVERALEVIQMIHDETTSSTTNNNIRLDTYCCIAAQAATLQKFHVAAQACQLIFEAGYKEVPSHVQSIIKQQGQKKPRM